MNTYLVWVLHALCMLLTCVSEQFRLLHDSLHSLWLLLRVWAPCSLFIAKLSPSAD